jgi:predicted permease
MSRELQFLVFIAFGLLCLVGGVVARERRWLDERHSATIHLHTLAWTWSAAALVGLWRIPINVQSLVVLGFQPVLMVIMCYSAIPIARLLGCSRQQTAVVALGSGFSNNGFTLGGFLAYLLIEPADASLAYGVAYSIVMSATAVFLIYPLARHYSPRPNDRAHWSMARLIAANFLNLRALPLYAGLLGALFSALKVPFPAFLEKYYLIHLIFYLGTLGGYGGIGLRLRIHHHEILHHLRPHLLLTVLKFALTPIIATALLLTLQWSGYRLDPSAYCFIILETLVPAGVLSVMLSNLFHLDARLASALWITNTLLFVVIPLPFILWWLG